ncbi:hypothetical protein Drorol1_Dr00006966 [Drosera rotundifolia]
MDLGCLDSGCVSLYDDKRVAADPSGSSADSPNSKSNPSKDSPRSSGSAWSRFTSQIKKPSQRRTSPLNWFPRTKVDSYLNRKIKSLQEAGGMNSTLDETLGDSNPHYCRVEREKMAAREAARKAMEARKAAMVEASWCRILRAARIQSKEAETKLLNAEKNVAEALEAATAKGVIMYDTLDCPRKKFVLETPNLKGKASTTHTIRASFETAFDVDKQVASALKTAFVRLANSSPSSNREEFKDLLKRISEIPDTGDLEFSSEYDSDMELDSEEEAQYDELRSAKSSTPQVSTAKARRMSLKARQSPQKYNISYLVDMMFERLKCLQEDELASLATIVATSGLNAVLAEVESHRQYDQSSTTSGTSVNFARKMPAYGAAAIRNSSIDFFMNGPTRKNLVEPEVPSLDKFLVKRMTKLEREREEARNSRKSGSTEAELINHEKSRISTDTLLDLGSMLVKHSSTLEKEKVEMKRMPETRFKSGRSSRAKEEFSEAVPSLDKCLVKHVSRLEREVEEAKMRRDNAFIVITPEEIRTNMSCSDKENYDVNKKAGLVDPNLAADRKGHEHEKTAEEKLCALGTGKWKARRKKQQGENNDANCESLDKVLVKHVCRLEKEKMELQTMGEDSMKVRIKENANGLHKADGGLDQILVKHRSRLEREKLSAAEHSEELPRSSVSRREARERELQEAWGGISLGNSMKPHVSRLEEARGRDEHEMFANAKHSKDQPRTSLREARDRELYEAWGGMGLGNSIKPHVSRLERDKAAWLKAEDQERKAAAAR